MSTAIDEFESAFQSMVSAITNHGANQIHDHDEVKTTVDQTTQKFIDSARSMEFWLLQKRMYLSMNNPEQLMEEDIADIRNEIERKELLIRKMERKIADWKSVLAEAPPQPMPQPGSGPFMQPVPGHPGMMPQQRPAFIPGDHGGNPGMYYNPYHRAPGPPPPFIDGVQPRMMARPGMNRPSTPGDNNPLSQLSNLSQNFRPRFA